jgi:hypothetical protein
VRRARTREFWHYSLGGELTIEEAQALEEDIERVECRWCGNTDQVEEIPRVGAEAEDDGR